MIRYDCRKCGENVFDVVDQDHLGDLPHTWTCSGCGRQYIGELTPGGKLVVYRKGHRPKQLRRPPARPARAAAPAPELGTMEIGPTPEPAAGPEPGDEPGGGGG